MTLAPVPASFFEIVAIEFSAWRGEYGLQGVVVEILASGERRESEQLTLSATRTKKWDAASWVQRCSKRLPALLCNGARRELLWRDAVLTESTATPSGALCAVTFRVSAAS